MSGVLEVEALYQRMKEQAIKSDADLTPIMEFYLKRTEKNPNVQAFLTSLHDGQFVAINEVLAQFNPAFWENVELTQPNIRAFKQIRAARSAFRNRVKAFLKKIKEWEDGGKKVQEARSAGSQATS